ncbi:MAG: murein biosynthesis integral membrane protein MurJ, partial [Candidatus Omnitrophica bacterium]|nr:murein biosynthesis integral membrane protein MurJ [Candidatus Omnitrophota bacterium]
GLSRLLGFVRDVLFANFFGTGFAAEAFVVAFRIPNLLRDLAGEGAANAAFVPVFSEYLYKKERQEFWRAVNAMLGMVLLVLSIFTVAGILFAEPVVRLIAPGFSHEAGKLLLTTQLTRITFPYILLIGLTAYQMGVLHTFKSFLTPALGPCMLNIGMILTMIFAVKFMQEPIIGVALGVLLGGLMQLAIQVPAMYRQGYRFSLLDLKLNFSHPAVKQIGRLLSPRILGSAVYQLNVFADTVFASLANIVGVGGIAAIYYANRIVQLPMAIFGIALSSAVLPTLSEHAAQNDITALKKTLNFSLKAIYLMIFPAAAGLMVLAYPIIRVIFQRGEFGAYSTMVTSQALLFYSVGLLAFACTKILVSCFYSLQDTTTPIRSAALALGINIILDALLMFPLKVGGLALASSISATFNFFNLLHLLHKKIGPVIDEHSYQSFLKISLAGLIMAVATHFIWQYAEPHFQVYLALGGTILCAAVIYFLTCLFLKVNEVHGLIRWILKIK